MKLSMMRAKEACRGQRLNLMGENSMDRCVCCSLDDILHQWGSLLWLGWKNPMATAIGSSGLMASRNDGPTISSSSEAVCRLANPVVVVDPYQVAKGVGGGFK